MKYRWMAICSIAGMGFVTACAADDPTPAPSVAPEDGTRESESDGAIAHVTRQDGRVTARLESQEGSELATLDWSSQRGLTRVRVHTDTGAVLEDAGLRGLPVA